MSFVAGCFTRQRMKPILYRPGSRWRLFAAFAAAAVIHVSALAFSPSHRSEIFDTAGPPEVILEPPAPEPQLSPQPLELEPLPTTPPSVSPNDFVEEPRPKPRHITKQAHRIRANSTPNLVKAAVGNGKAYTVNAPLPVYPYEARVHDVTGSGEVLLEVDPVSGSVLDARMTESTGSPILDNSAANAFRQWRFRPGTPSQIRIPFTFTIVGARL